MTATGRRELGKRHIAILLAILGLGLGLRLWGLTQQTLSMDEVAERFIAQKSVGEILVEPNSFPPLYHLLLKGWLKISDAEVSSRVLSVVLGLACIVATWALVLDTIDLSTAQWTALLMAVSPFHHFYSQDGRAYMLYFLVAVLAVWTAVQWSRERSPATLVRFVIVAVLGAYVHYYFVIVLVSVVLSLIADQGIRMIPRAMVPALVIGVLCLPLLLWIHDDVTFQRDLRDPRPINFLSLGYTFFSFVSGYTLGPSRSQLHFLTRNETLRLAAPWLFVGGLSYGTLIATGWWSLDRCARWFWPLLLLLPFGLIGLPGVVLGLTYNPRFMVWCLLPFLVLAARGLAVMRPTWQALGLSLVLAISLVAIGNRQLSAHHQNEDMRSIGTYLSEHPRHPVVVCAGYMDGPLKYYGPSDMEVIPIDVSEGEEATRVALERLASLEGQPYWVVYSRSFHADPDGAVLRYVTDVGRGETQLEVAGIQLLLVP